MKLFKCKYCREKKEVQELSSRIPQVCKNTSCISKYYDEYREKINDKAKSNLKKELFNKNKSDKESLMSRKDWLGLAQKTFNTYIRLRDKGKPCCACGNEIKGVTHASHYLSQGNHSFVRFHEDNVFSGCYKCNVELSGNLIEYRKRLLIEIGQDRLNWLEENGMREKKWEINEIKEIITKYKQKIKEL